MDERIIGVIVAFIGFLFLVGAIFVPALAVGAATIWLLEGVTFGVQRNFHKRQDRLKDGLLDDFPE